MKNIELYRVTDEEAFGDEYFYYVLNNKKLNKYRCHEQLPELIDLSFGEVLAFTNADFLKSNVYKKIGEFSEENYKDEIMNQFPEEFI